MAPLQNMTDLYSFLIRLIEKFISLRYWKIKLVFILTVVSVTLSTPQYLKVPGSFKNNPSWLAFDQKKKDLLSQPNFNPRTNAAKKTFRLTVPAIAKVFHLNNYAVLALQFFIGMLFLYFTIVLTEKITGDSIAAFLTTAGLVFIYTGHSAFTDVITWFDAFAFFFLLLAMLYSNVTLIIFFMQLAAWTDERAVIAGGFIFIWWKLKELKKSDFNFISLFKLGWQSSAVIFSLVLYLITRYLISIYAHIHTPQDGIGLNDVTNYIGLGLWSALEGFWILIIIVFIILIENKKYFLAFFISGMMTIILAVAFSVFDITRSAAYLFPVIFICILILSQIFSTNALRKILIVCAFVSFLFPSYYIITSRPQPVMWYKPIFIRAIDQIRIHYSGVDSTNNDQ